MASTTWTLLTRILRGIQDALHFGMQISSRAGVVGLFQRGRLVRRWQYPVFRLHILVESIIVWSTPDATSWMFGEIRGTCSPGSISANIALFSY